MALPELTVNDTTDLLAVSQFANTSTGGTLFPVILLVIWIIAFIGSIAESRDVSRAWIFASFVGAIMAVMLVLVGLMDAVYMYFLFLNIAISVAWMSLSKSRND